MAPAPTLFEAVPEGFDYRRDVISPADELRLAGEVGRLKFGAFEMPGRRPRP